MKDTFRVIGPQQSRGGLASKDQSQLELPVIGKELLGHSDGVGMAGGSSLIVFAGGKPGLHSLTFSL